MDIANLTAQLADARARILKLERELSDRDKQLEAVITDCDKDIVDLRRSFEVDTLRRSRVLNEQISHQPCSACAELKEEIKKYQSQWETISKHFHQVPGLLDSMISRTDSLVNNITKLAHR